ncbi:hypothetical protein ACQWU4_04810 [Chryseobacterium sp. MIQD13]|uniref:hypothetical protein n=1 Tax=Chryseobacterium sp. MIQD13 TaxID=3422310 RepID=UPI003D2C0590
MSVLVFSQVGINTAIPKTTMDVDAKRDGSGIIINNTQLIGLQAPRLTRAELTNNTATYAADQKGALVYITDISGGTALGQRINITAVGYYYFDGTLWQKVGNGAADINIYKDNGTLTSTRTLTQAGFPLTFTNTQKTNFYNDAGVGILQDSGTGTRSSIGLSNGGSTQLWLYSDTNSAAQIMAANTSTSLSIGTSGTNASADISFITTPGATVGTERMRITGKGNVSIGNIMPTEMLDNNGITRLRTLPINGATNAINTTSSGSLSAAKDQTFTATRTVVADANGVLGYVNGLPSSGNPGGFLNVGETISQFYSVPAAAANVNTFNLKTYVTANSLPALPVLDGLEMNLQGVNGTYYDPRLYNVSSGNLNMSYQTFATQVNENETSLNNNLASGGYVQVDANNIVFWSTSAAEVITTNLQVQIDTNTYRWYEFKWWCMEVSGNKTIFLSVMRKA